MPDTPPPEMSPPEPTPDDQPLPLEGLEAPPAADTPAEPVKRRPGRPKGSRNKPKVDPETGDTIPAPEPKPRRRRPSTSSASSTAGDKPPTAKAIADAVAGVAVVLQVGGTMASPKLGYDAAVIAGKADEIGAELHKLAKRSPAVCRVLNRALAAGDYGGLVMLAVSIAVPILANHGVIPAFAAAMIPGAPPVPAPPPEPAAAPTPSSNGATPFGDLFGAPRSQPPRGPIVIGDAAADD